MWPRPSNFGYIAMGSSQWNGAAACGECISIKGPGGTFMGIVGDQCPSVSEARLCLRLMKKLTHL